MSFLLKVKQCFNSAAADLLNMKSIRCVKLNIVMPYLSAAHIQQAHILNCQKVAFSPLCWQQGHLHLLLQEERALLPPLALASQCCCLDSCMRIRQTTMLVQVLLAQASKVWALCACCAQLKEVSVSRNLTGLCCNQLQYRQSVWPYIGSLIELEWSPVAHCRFCERALHVHNQQQHCVRRVFCPYYMPSALMGATCLLCCLQCRAHCILGSDSDVPLLW